MRLFQIVSNLFILGMIVTPCVAQNVAPVATTTAGNDLLSASPFIQIPGPNPILIASEGDNWDRFELECSGIFKNFGTYHLYYHAVHGPGEHYQIGVATAKHPLGPFKRFGEKPLIPHGEPGQWDDKHAAHALVLKEGTDKYYMWYCGYGTRADRPENPGRQIWDIGLATASSPTGPWIKHESNPIIKDFGYVCAVVKANGKYYMYSAWPIDSTAYDYSPISVAVADKPEGPWKPHGEPVLHAGNPGEWDQSGFSDASVIYSAGVFHLFYAGAKAYVPRRLTRESIGYAYSFDGINFHKYGHNPIATREADPNAASFSEPRALIELPYIYIYHTLRYKSPPNPRMAKIFPDGEDLGVQVLATQRPFKLDMPIMAMDTLSPGDLTDPMYTPRVSLVAAKTVALTINATFGEDASASLRLSVRSSADGLAFDTVDTATFELKPRPGESSQQTFPLETNAKFIKVIVQNLDGQAPVKDVRLFATLGG